jgi:hypothetical protein
MTMRAVAPELLAGAQAVADQVAQPAPGEPPGPAPGEAAPPDGN